MIAARHLGRFIYSQPSSLTHNCSICPLPSFPFHFNPFSLRPDAACYAAAVAESLKMSPNKDSKEHELIDHTQAFENTSTNVAAAQMRNALTNLAETVEDPKEKKVRLTRIPAKKKRWAPWWLLMQIACLAVRDRDGQLLCPLPTIPQRQGQGKCSVCCSLALPLQVYIRWTFANEAIATGTALPLPPRARSSTTRTSPTLSLFSS